MPKNFNPQKFNTMKAQEIKEQLKAEGLWDENKQWIIDKMTDIEDLASDILSSQSDNRFQLEFEPDFFHKQQGRIKSNLHKIDGTSIYFTIQDFRVNFNKDFETHCQKHGIDDKRGFLTGLKDAYDFVLSEYESVSENALLLTYKEKDCFRLDESEIKGYADKKAQTLLYHLEAIIKEIEDRIKDIDERADAIISNSLSSPATEDDAQSLPPDPNSESKSTYKEIISETFESMDNKGWGYAFRSEYDYNLFVDLLTNFFEGKPYSLPEKTIQLKRRCKTKVATELEDIYNTLGEGILKSDKNFFAIIKILSEFNTLTDNDLYKALTK